MNKEKMEIQDYVKAQLYFMSKVFFEQHIDNESRIINENGKEIGRLKDNLNMNLNDILNCSFKYKKGIRDELTIYIIDGLYGVQQMSLEKYSLNEYVVAMTETLYYSNSKQILEDFMEFGKFKDLNELLKFCPESIN